MIAAVAALGAACAPGPAGEGSTPDDTVVARPAPGAVRPVPIQPGPTTEPPTDEPPTDEPPTNAPPTNAPPTDAPPSTITPPAGTTSFKAASTRSSIGDCEIFPADHYMNATNIDQLPVHPSSDQWLSGQRSRGSKITTPSSTVWQGSSTGIPINEVDSRVTGKKSVIYTVNASPHEYRGSVPLPAQPRVEGHPGAAWDRHVLVVDRADCTAYELIQYEHTLAGFGPRTANSGAKYKLDSTARVKFTTNSPNTPMVGQAFRLDEVNAGAVHHVTAFCSDTIASSHVWPASSSDGRRGESTELPMGAWARLKSTVDLNRFSGQARAMAQSLRTHGAVLTDTCSQSMHLTGENSTGWNASQMRQLQELTANDFEIVDTTPLKVSDDSWAIR